MLDDGQEVVLKAGLEANVDAFVLERLADSPVPVPTLLGLSPLMVKAIQHWLTIMTLEPEELLAEQADLGKYLPQLIVSIHDVHLIRASSGAGPVLAVEERQHQSWKSYLLSILGDNHADFRWTEIAEHPEIDGPTVCRVVHALEAHVQAIPDLPDLSLLHGDLNPFNVFVKNGQISSIIDWSYLRYGDPLFDFARLRMNGIIRMSSTFLDLYFLQLGLTEAEAAREQSYYLFNVLEYVNWYVDDENAHRAREHLQILEQELLQ